MMMLILVALAVGLVSWYSLGVLIGFLVRKDIVDRPNDRTLHQGVIPRGGGLVIIATLLTGLALVAFVSGQFLFFSSLFLLMLAWASLSWYDDKHDLSARFRFLIQLVLSLITVLAFGWVDRVSSFELMWLGPVVSLIGLVWMANLYNFMDGLDGLAGSQSIIACLSLGFWFYISGAPFLGGICLLVAASSYGFVLRNWSPAQIFMGDVGSITLGAFFGTLIIIGVSRYNLPVLSFVALFAVFIVDATVTIVLRAFRREKIWLPHRQHFYQRLANAGYSHSSIALGALVLMVLCSLLATIGIAYHDMMTTSIFGTFVLILAAIALVLFLEKRAGNNLTNN